MKHGIMLVGCGSMAQVHCDQISKLDNVRFVCAADVDAAKAESFQKQYGFERTAGDFKRELARDDFDIVLVATTWQPRYDIIRACFEAGKHVLAEKPLTLYLDEAEELFALADSKGLKLRVGHNMRYRPMILKATELLREGAISRPRAYTFIHHQSPAKSQKDIHWPIVRNLLRGGVTPNIDCGVHYCDFVRQWAGCEAESVFSIHHKLDPDCEGDNFSHSVFRFTDGASLVLDECYSNHTRSFVQMTILGDRGRIQMCYAKSSVWSATNDEEDIIHVWHGDTYHTETFHTPLAIKTTGPQMEAFIREIETDADLSKHKEDVLRSTEMVAASALAGARGRLVELPLDAEARQDIKKIITK